MNFSDWQTQK